MILKPQFLLETYAVNPKKVWADETSSGTHPGLAIIKQIFPQEARHRGGVGEALEENWGGAKN
jgi:hypothetical protein